MKKTYLFAAAFLSLFLIANIVNAQTLGRLWGMTYIGGDSVNGGVIFNYDANNSHDSTVRSLPGGAIYPYYNDLIQASDGNFYGMCSGGGIDGVLFKCTPTGQYVTLHDFTGGSADGGNPQGSLIQATDGNLYGMTYEGGTGGGGTIFKCTTAGVITTLVNFSNSEKPLGNLMQASDGNFYGMTHGGGSSGDGTIFKCTTAGVLTTLVNFTGINGANPGANPNGTLIQATDGNLYGMTSQGGASNDGTIFKCSTSGSMTVLVNFTGASGAAPGSTPYGRLLQIGGGTLYGMTELGGANGDGVLFSCTISGTYSALVTFNGASNGSNPYGSLIQGTDGNLYGVTRNGGPTSNGEVFKCTTTGTLTVVKGFSSGIFPYGSLIQATDGNLYGITSVGGSSGLGTVYKCTTGGTLTYIVNFGAFDVGNTPFGSLIQATNGALYGMTTRGGTPGYGTIFKWAAGTMSTIYNFTDGADGGEPNGSLVQASDGNFYGMTNDNNNIFRCTPAGAFSNLVTLVAATQGSNLTGSLIQATDGNLYGMANQGGTLGDGTIFKCTTAGAITVLVNFNGSGYGANPHGSLIQATDGNLYGMTSAGGTHGYGTLFKCSTTGSITVLVNFASDETPLGNLIQASDGNLYGMSQHGGTGSGTVFKCTTGGTLTTLYTFSNSEYPEGSLIQGSDGNLYGMALNGGSNGSGYVFKCTMSGALTNLFSFTGNNGENPQYGNLLEAMSATITNAPVCATPNTSTLTAVTRGGNGPFTYSWSSGATTSSITGNVSTVYTVTVTDARGIAVGASINVPVYTSPTVTTAGSNTICNGNSTSITATPSGGTGPFGYVWSPATGLVTPTGSLVVAGPSSTQTYTVTVTDANNCTATAAFPLTVNPTPTVSATPGSSAICQGSSTGITSTVSGGVPPYTYNWGPSTSLSSGSTQNVTATPSSTTTYTLFATDANGCVSVVDVPVTVNSLPNVTANFTSSPICLGGNTMLTASGANSYAWSPAATLSVSTGTSVTATPTISTTYSVIGTDANGCQNTGTTPVVVNALPSVIATPTGGTICSGNSMSVTASGANTYAWGPSTGLSVTTGAGVTATPASSQTYTVVGTNTVTGCQNSAITTITVNATPTVTAIASITPICSGNTSNLTASGAASYTWAPAASLNKSTGAFVTATPTTSITYTVTGTSASGCTNTATVSVAVNATPTLSALAAPASICSGSSTTLTASGGATYTWSTGATTSTIAVSPTSDITYTLNGSSASGCAGAAATVTVYINPTPTLTATAAPASVCSGGSTTLTGSGGATYTWSTGATNASISVSPTSATTYTLNGSSASGCAGAATTVTVSVNSNPTVTANASAPTICIGSNTTLTASGATTYSWLPTTGLSATTGAVVVATPTASVTYTVTGTNGSGCYNEATVVITVNSLPTVSATAGSSAICQGSSTSLTGSGAVTYTWAPATGLSVTTGISVTADPTSAQTYTVTGTDANGCVSTGTAAISINALPSVSGVASPTTICAGNSTTLSGSGASTYAWSPATSLNSSTGTVVTATPSVTTAYTVTGTNGNGCSNTANVVVIVDVPVINFTKNNISCNGACNGTILANVSGGTAPYSYLWSDSKTTDLISNLCQGTYSLTLTDNLGCTSQKSTVISQPAAITINTSSTATTCGQSNGTVSATASGGTTPYNYSWNTSPVQTGSTVTALASGTYSVTVTDGNGCTATASVSVTGSSGPSILTTKVNQSNCGKNDGNATITVTGGLLPYTYSWNNGDTTHMDTALAAGTYIATVIDKNGCSTFEAVTISDAGAPAITLNTLTDVTCNGNANGAISLSVTGGTSPYTYSWSNSATTKNISSLTAGPYQFTVADANGCTTVETFNITQPSALVTSFSSTQASCGNSDGSVSVMVTGGTSPYVYSWNTGATTSALSSEGAGTYSVTVTDKNGCTLSAQASVSNVSGPLVTIDSVVSISCATGPVGKITETTNGGTLPYTYLWSNGSITANIYGLAAGNYALTVTDANGCKGTANATITQTTLDTIRICMATVDPATNYNNLLWNAGSASPKVASFNIYKETTTPGVFGKIGSSPAGQGLYIDTLSDARRRSWRYELSQVDSCGNESPLSKPFKTMHLTINPSGSTVNLIWDNFQGISFNYYIVYRDSVPGVANDSIDYVTNNGIYTYTDYPSTKTNWYYHMGISGNSDCGAPIQKPHSVEGLNYNASKSNTGNIIFVEPTSVQNISSFNSLDIYPNPNTGAFTIAFDLNKQQNVNVKVYNELGQVIVERNFEGVNGKVTKQFDLSEYSKGLYIVRISTEDGVEYRKVAIQ